MAPSRTPCRAPRHGTRHGTVPEVYLLAYPDEEQVGNGIIAEKHTTDTPTARFLRTILHQVTSSERSHIGYAMLS